MRGLSEYQSIVGILTLTEVLEKLLKLDIVDERDHMADTRMQKLAMARQKSRLFSVVSQSNLD